VASGGIKSSIRHHIFKEFLILGFLQIHETSDSNKAVKAFWIAGVYGTVSDSCKEERPQNPSAAYEKLDGKHGIRQPATGTRHAD
jgi:hypothetical protein